MDPIYWFVGFIVVMILIGVIQNIINPPHDLKWEEVPAAVREAVSGTFADFEVSKVRYIPVARKYKMHGDYRGRDVEVEVEGNKNGSIREIELEDLKQGQMTRLAPIGFEELPSAVTEHLSTLVGPDFASLQTHRLSKGIVNGEPAYKIKGHTGNSKWEFEIYENGQLIEVETSPRA
ncbi:hypothetical protein [Haloferula sp.]|uniref:hypothetical protein n=1 Tax=Haloferula sp. TaxID=2497595 RepID=UPI00329FBC68